MNRALADGPNPFHASIRAYAENNQCSEIEAHRAIWGDHDD